MADQQASERARNDKKHGDPNFRLKQALYSSYMQNTADPRQATTQSDTQYKNQQKGTTESAFWKAPSSVSTSARNKFYHSS